ncbi:hypothetical protein HZB03_05320 [Candidatus Woesearchaeota archaeon]|nr:hypothetical protein [Candidatus Woesearchaeota archaeon]
MGDGKIQEITTSLTGRKGTEFKKRFMREGSNRRKTFYIGDDYDGEDRSIAELLPQTNFIVPWFAPDAKKQELTNEFQAFVPKDPTDLLRYLKFS